MLFHYNHTICHWNCKPNCLNRLILSNCSCPFFFFKHSAGSLPVRLQAGCHHHVCVHLRRDPIMTSGTHSRTSDEEAAHVLSSWTTECWATAVTGAGSEERRPEGGLSSGRGISQVSGRGNGSWTEKKREDTMMEEGTRATGAETQRCTRTIETFSSCTARTAVKTVRRLFTRNTKSVARNQNKMKTQRVFMTLYLQPGEPMRDTHQAPQVLTCTQLNFCLLSERGTYSQRSGGDHRRMPRGLVPAGWQALATSWRDYWTWCLWEPEEPHEQTVPLPDRNPQQAGMDLNEYTNLFKTNILNIPLYIKERQWPPDYIWHL